MASSPDHPPLEPPTADELDALDALGVKDVDVPGARAHATNLNRSCSPAREKGEAPVTKRELVRYFASIAPTLLPYLASRPLNLNRFPDGVVP